MENNLKSKKKTGKQIIGQIGETLACRFLETKNYKILTRNYLKPYGEIDIVARLGDKTVFIEVKSVTRHFEAKKSGQAVVASVSYETNTYRPEDNIHTWKLKRLTRVINTYLVEERIKEGGWAFDVIMVYLNPETKKAKIEHLENIVL